VPRRRPTSRPPIPAREAKKSVKLLEKLGLIARGKDGKWAQESAAISTGEFT